MRKIFHHHHKPNLDDAEVLSRAKHTLQDHFPLQANGYCCNSSTLYDVLIGVAANKGTIQSVCADLAGAPDSQTIRTYINDQLLVEDLPELERCINAALRANWPNKLRRSGPVEVAMDFHDRCYYGKAKQSEALFMRGEAKAGTTRFYRVATSYVIKRGQRVTLSLHFVLPGQQVVDKLAEMLRKLRQCGLKISCLYLDKGFACVSVFEYLRRQNQPSLIACPIRGKKAGTRVLCKGLGSYNTDYTFTNKDGQQYVAQVAMCRVMTRARRTGKDKPKWKWLMFVEIGVDWGPKKCRRKYKKRFGIESSYRLVNKVLGWTTSPNAAYRFVLMGLGFILLNLWVNLCWEYTQVARRGGRKLARENFRQQRFIKFLIRALERIYGCVTLITAPSVPLL